MNGFYRPSDTGRRIGAILVAALLVLRGSDAGTCRAGESEPFLGAGLHRVADYSRSNEFTDLMKQAREWGHPTQPWDHDPPIGVDAEAWPASDFGVIVFVEYDDVAGYGGIYKLSCECATTPTIAPVASQAQVQNVVRNPATGVVTADVFVEEFAGELMLSFTGTNGGVRNLKLLRPGYAGSGEVFTQQFLDHVSRFNVIRFMDWTNTNGNATAQWSERALPGDPSYAGYTNPGGVPWEICAELCNIIDADMWINVPHMATDDYVHQLATLLLNTLEPDRKVYVEYSNEVWNWGFGQAGWNLQQAVDEVAADPDSNLAYDGSPIEGFWAARRIARRVKEIGDIFRAVWGETTFAQRIRPVLGVQSSYPELWLDQGLTFLNDVFGPPGDFLYAAAGAPYINLGAADENPDLTADQVLDALEADADDCANNIILERNAVLTVWYDLKFLAYEGGPDTFGGNNIQAKKEASHHPRMRDICKQYLANWYGYDFGLFMWFVAGARGWDSQYGTWTLTDDMNNQATPKILAVDDVLAAPKPPAVEGRPVPGTVDARRHAARDEDWQTADPYLQFIGPGQTHDYLIRSTMSAPVEIKFYVTAGSALSGHQIEVLRNGASVGFVEVPNTGHPAHFAPSTTLYFTLTPGMNVIRLSHTAGYAYNVHSLFFLLAEPLVLPTTSTWGMIVMTLLLLLTGSIMLRRGRLGPGGCRIRRWPSALRP